MVFYLRVMGQRSFARPNGRTSVPGPRPPLSERHLPAAGEQNVVVSDEKPIHLPRWPILVHERHYYAYRLSTQKLEPESISNLATPDPSKELSCTAP
jgi:hypothetical protein